MPVTNILLQLGVNVVRVLLAMYIIAFVPRAQYTLCSNKAYPSFFVRCRIAILPRGPGPKHFEDILYMQDNLAPQLNGVACVERGHSFNGVVLSYFHFRFCVIYLGIAGPKSCLVTPFLSK